MNDEIKILNWYAVDEGYRPPLQRFHHYASVHCALMVSSQETPEFQLMFGYYDYGENRFVVLQNGRDILDEWGFTVSHFMLVPTPSGKLI